MGWSMTAVTANMAGPTRRASWHGGAAPPIMAREALLTHYDASSIPLSVCPTQGEAARGARAIASQLPHGRPPTFPPLPAPSLPSPKLLLGLVKVMKLLLDLHGGSNDLNE